jgi:hypothetical protein
MKLVKSSMMACFIIRHHIKFHEITGNEDSGFIPETVNFRDFLIDCVIWIKEHLTPKFCKIMFVVHKFNFFKVNKTRLKYTAKFQNKKDDVYGNLMDVKIDLKNLNQRQISCLYVAFERECHEAVFNEEKELFLALFTCIGDCEHIRI